MEAPEARIVSYLIKQQKDVFLSSFSGGPYGFSYIALIYSSPS